MVSYTLLEIRTPICILTYTYRMRLTEHGVIKCPYDWTYFSITLIPCNKYCLLQSSFSGSLCSESHDYVTVWSILWSTLFANRKWVTQFSWKHGYIINYPSLLPSGTGISAKCTVQKIDKHLNDHLLHCVFLASELGDTWFSQHHTAHHLKSSFGTRGFNNILSFGKAVTESGV
jgi:hypothetical protein